MINDADRRKLFEALRATIGPEPSELLMELLPPTGWAHLATSADVSMLRTDIDIAKTELRIEIQDVRTELKGDIQEVRSEVQDLRGRIDGLVPKLVAANIASMIGIAGLVLGAVSIA